MIRVTNHPRLPVLATGAVLVVGALAGCVPAKANAVPPTATARSTATAVGSVTPTSPATQATTASPATIAGRAAPSAPTAFGPAPATRHTTGTGTSAPSASATIRPGSAVTTLAALTIRGRAARTGYDRDLFGQAWADVDRNGCDTRNDILRRDLTGLSLKPETHGCVVLRGTLADPYTGATIAFVRGRGTSNAVQVDHVVALSDAWQKGAQRWSTSTRTAFANDPLNLLAVDGPTNQRKGDGDAATWLPPRKAVRCQYVARQVAVKARYALSVTVAERDAMVRVLTTCPAQPLQR